VLTGRRIAVFVHGCFWHMHAGCCNAVIPKTRTEFWRSKLRGNVTRDRIAIRALRRLGWRVLVVWECELEKIDELGRKLQRAIAASAK